MGEGVKRSAERGRPQSMFDLKINTTIAEHGPMMKIVACLGVGVSVMRLCWVWVWGVYTVCLCV